MTDKRDYYEVLEIGRNATAEEIKRSYRSLARKYHPDVNREAGAESTFKEVAEAYEILSDEQKRAAYDRYGHQAFNGGGGQPGGFGDIFDIFGDIFGGMAGRARPTGPVAEPGDDLRVDLEITLEEAAHGTTKTLRFATLGVCDQCDGSGAKPGTIAESCPTCRGMGYVRHTQNTLLGTFQTQTTCPRCRGEGSVVQSPCGGCNGAGRVRKSREHILKVPPGVDTGTRLRLHGQGDAGLRGGRPGNLDVVIHVKSHPSFERRGNDLWCEINVSFARAALGGKMRVPTIWGEDEFDLPEGTQPGAHVKLRERGVPDLNGRGKGDQYVVVNVQVPTKLSADQKSLLKQFAGTMGESLGDDKGILGKVFKR